MHTRMSVPNHIAGKGLFRIGGAVLFGAGIIGIAFFIQHRTLLKAEAQTPALVVARGDVRTIQPALDTDGDGFPDWEEALLGTDPRAYTSPEEARPAAATTTEPYAPPTTLTARFSEQFLENIIRTGGGQPMTDEQKAQLVAQSVGTLAVETADRLYTQADIKSIADNDLAALHTYGNALGDVFLTSSEAHEPELTILGRAVQANDPRPLAGLKPIEDAYAGMIRAILRVETPSSMAKEHVALVNALVAIQTDIAAMREMFTDPLASLVRIRRYEDDARGLADALDSIRVALEKSGVAYASGEPGIMLFSLRP